MMDSAKIEKTYHLARERYSQLGVNSDRALEILENMEEKGLIHRYLPPKSISYVTYSLYPLYEIT